MMKNQQLYRQLIDSTTVNINGLIQNAGDAKISVFDRGFLYGDSVYDVTYAENGHIIFFKEHLDRLYNSAALIDLNIYIEREEIIEQTRGTLLASGLDRAYIRIIVTRGEADLGLDPAICFQNNYVIIVKPLAYYPQELYQKGLYLHIPSVERMNRNAVNPNAKSGNYLNNVLAINEAKKIGADDALMLNAQGFVTEGTSFNIWIVKDNTIYTPPVESGLLEGITRQKIIQICEDNGYTYKLANLTKEDLYNCDEAFISSSTKGLMPVYKIDQNNLSDSAQKRPITMKLSSHYKELIDDEQN